MNSYQYIVGVRKYDYETGRFNSPDVLWEKYYGWTPYQYCMNNPIWAKDWDGMKLSFTGSNTAVDKAYSVINQGTGGFYNSVTNSDGNTILDPTGLHGPQSESQLAFTNEMLKAVDLSKPLININLTESNNTLIGNYERQEIDIDDVLNLGNGIGLNSNSGFIHEIAEQREKQYNGLLNTPSGYWQSHNAGVKAENSVSGAVRLDVFGWQKSSTYSNKTGNGIMDLLYYKFGNGEFVKSINIKGNNVIGVK